MPPMSMKHRLIIPNSCYTQTYDSVFFILYWRKIILSKFKFWKKKYYFIFRFSFNFSNVDFIHANIRLLKSLAIISACMFSLKRIWLFIFNDKEKWKKHSRLVWIYSVVQDPFVWSKISVGICCLRLFSSMFVCSMKSKANPREFYREACVSSTIHSANVCSNKFASVHTVSISTRCGGVVNNSHFAVGITSHGRHYDN